MQSGGWQHHEGLPEAAPPEASFHAGDGWAGSGTLLPLPGSDSEAAGSGGSAASSQHPGCEDGPLFDSDTPQVTGNYRCSELQFLGQASLWAVDSMHDRAPMGAWPASRGRFRPNACLLWHARLAMPALHLSAPARRRCSRCHHNYGTTWGQGTPHGHSRHLQRG